MVPAQSTTKAASCAPIRACWLRAWDRAKAEKLIPFFNVDGTWSVKTYTVRITGAGWSDLSCSCPAGCNGRICKHAAVVAKAIAAHVLPVRGTEKGKEGVATAPLSQAWTTQTAAIVSLHVPSPLDALYA